MSFLLALLAAAFYGSGDFFGGLAARRAPVVPVAFVSLGVGLVAVVVLAPLTAGRAPVTADLAWGAAAGLASGIAISLLYHALAVGAVSVVAPVSALVGLVFPVVVGVALGDVLSPAAGAGIALAAIAIVLISREPAHAEGVDPPASPTTPWARKAAAGRWSALGVAIAAGIFIGAFLVCLSRAPSDGGLWPLLASRAVSVASLGLAARRGGHARLPAGPARRAAAASGLLDIVANVCYLTAVRSGMLSLVATLTNLYPAATVILARVVLGEQMRPVQRVGMALALAAVVLIAR